MSKSIKIGQNRCKNGQHFGYKDEKSVKIVVDHEIGEKNKIKK